MKGITALLGLAVVGFLAYCYGKSRDVSSGAVSTPESASPPKETVVSTAPIAIDNYKPAIASTQKMIVASVAKSAPNRALYSTILPQTRRMQALS
jgi:hypothetical protein